VGGGELGGLGLRAGSDELVVVVADVDAAPRLGGGAALPQREPTQAPAEGGIAISADRDGDTVRARHLPGLVVDGEVVAVEAVGHRSGSGSGLISPGCGGVGQRLGVAPPPSAASPAVTVFAVISPLCGATAMWLLNPSW